MSLLVTTSVLFAVEDSSCSSRERCSTTKGNWGLVVRRDIGLIKGSTVVHVLSRPEIVSLVAPSSFKVGLMSSHAFIADSIMPLARGL